jgi:hypothetical protein
MIEVSVGGERRDARDATTAWLRSGIDRHRQLGSPVCVKVGIKSGAIDMILATEDCPNDDAEGRPFRPEERKIFELWKGKNLDTNHFTVNDLAEFLVGIRDLC